MVAEANKPLAASWVSKLKPERLSSTNESRFFVCLCRFQLSGNYFFDTRDSNLELFLDSELECDAGEGTTPASSGEPNGDNAFLGHRHEVDTSAVRLGIAANVCHGIPDRFEQRAR